MHHWTQASLVDAVTRMRGILESAISSGEAGGKRHTNGQDAKNAAIRSSKPIQEIHTVTRDAISNKLSELYVENFSVFPPLGSTKPELKLAGLLKSKNQDVTVTLKRHEPQTLDSGARDGETDAVGFDATNSAMAIGVRSQLSSVDKNFDTLMERAFAETLNLRLRCPDITLGDVYVVPLYEIDDKAATNHVVKYKSKMTDVSKFVRLFSAITKADHKSDPLDLYKYNATSLVIADFSSEEIRIAWTPQELASWGFGESTQEAFDSIKPEGFVERIVDVYAAMNHLVAKP
jgi:hypothetical protein